VSAIVPLTVPSGCTASEVVSTVWPALAVLNATVTAGPCESQPPPETAIVFGIVAEDGDAVSVCVLKASVAVPCTVFAGPLPATGVMLGSFTTTCALGPAGTVVGTVIVPLNTGVLNCGVAGGVAGHSGLAVA